MKLPEATLRCDGFENQLHELQARTFRFPDQATSGSEEIARLQSILEKIGEALASIYGDRIRPIFGELRKGGVIEITINDIVEFINNFEGKYVSDARKKNYFTLSNQNLINLEFESQTRFQPPPELETPQLEERQEDQFIKCMSQKNADLEDEIQRLINKVGELERSNVQAQEQSAQQVTALQTELEQLKLREDLLEEDDTMQRERSLQEQLAEALSENQRFREQIDQLTLNLNDAKMSAADSMRLLQTDNIQNRIMNDRGRSREKILLKKERENSYSKLSKHRFKDSSKEAFAASESSFEQSLSIQKAAVEREKEELSAQLAESKGELLRLQESYGQLQTTLEILQETAKEDINLLNLQLSTAKSALESETAKNKELLAEIDQLQDELKSLHIERETFQNQLQFEKMRFEDELINLESEKAKLSETNSQLQETLNGLYVKMSESESKLYKYVDNMSSDQETIKKLRSEVGSYQDRLGQALTKLDQKTKEIEELKSESEKMQRYISSLLV